MGKNRFIIFFLQFVFFFFALPEITTTHIHTTTATTENVRETTKHFHTTTQRVIRFISITTSNSSSRTTEDNQIKGTSEKPADSIVTTKNLLILGIFGVSLILFTLLIVFSCKAIYKRCSSRKHSNNKSRQTVKPLFDEELAQYEEISDIRLLSNAQAKYSPLRPYTTIEENKNSVKSASSSEETSLLSSRGDPEGKYITCISDSVENNSYTDTGLLDPSNIHIPILESTVSDAEGYEIPRSPVTKSRTITEEACAMKSTENSEKNDEYLTVVSDGFDRG